MNRMWVGLMMGLAACGVIDPSRFEGDNAFECEDGADNDRDGLFDCADDDCTGSPSCDGYVPLDPDTDDGDTDGDGDTDDPNAVADHLQTIHLTYTQTHDIAAGTPGIGETACDSWDLCDCVLIATGTGTLVSAEHDLVTFLGTWEVSNADAEDACGDAILAGSWLPDDGVAYHSFRFKNGLSTLDQWIAHANLNAVDPQQPLTSNQQFGIWLMNADFDESDNSADHTESSAGTIELFSDDVVHRVEVSFSE